MKLSSKLKEIVADIVTDPIVFAFIILPTTCYFMMTALISVNAMTQEAQWSNDRVVFKVYRVNGEDGNDSRVRIVASRLPKNAVAEQSLTVKNEQDSDQDVEVLYDVYNQKAKSLDLFQEPSRASKRYYVVKIDKNNQVSIADLRSDEIKDIRKDRNSAFKLTVQKLNDKYRVLIEDDPEADAKASAGLP